MRRSDLQRLVDLALLAAGSLAFASGLVLLACFHMDDGPYQRSALGLPRLAWLNLHRLPALLLAAAAAVHVALHWRAMLGWLRRALARGRGAGRELLLYATFWTVALTGLAAWTVVGGSAPLAGPIPLARLPHLRHALVDVHDLTGLVALALVVRHAGHRWRLLARGLGTWARRLPAAREG